MQSKPPDTMKWMNPGGKQVALTHRSDWFTNHLVQRIKAEVYQCLGRIFFSLEFARLLSPLEEFIFISFNFAVEAKKDLQHLQENLAPGEILYAGKITGIFVYQYIRICQGGFSSGNQEMNSDIHYRLIFSTPPRRKVKFGNYQILNFLPYTICTELGQKQPLVVF